MHMHLGIAKTITYKKWNDMRKQHIMGNRLQNERRIECHDWI